MKKKSRMLSPVAQKISDLIESVGGGSQRTFAGLVGCSQPVISRIVNGQQKPGRDLIERIDQLDGVDREAIMASLDEPIRFDITDDFLIPIVSSLLRSPPEPDQITASSLAVSHAIYRPTLYAVQASACEPAFDDPSEKLRPNDLIVIDSSTDRFQQNQQMLNGKLCAVIDKGENITLRRVWIKFDDRQKKRVLFTCPDAKVECYLNQKFGEKLLRSIQLDPPEQVPEREFIDDKILVTSIVGIAVQIIRNV